MMLAARRQAIMVIGAFLLPIIVIAVVQVANGEQCDDGNLVSGDGCSATCHDDTIVTK